MTSTEVPTKIAILGGGIAALAAAFELTESDPQRNRYDITVYQVGWRLGGKGSVGWTTADRLPEGLKESKCRIEHGLHVWAGFYDNSFELLKRCYAAHDDPPFQDWRDAFKGLDRCWVEEYLDEVWQAWMQYVPANGQVAGWEATVQSPLGLWGRLLGNVLHMYLASGLGESFAGRAAERDPNKSNAFNMLLSRAAAGTSVARTERAMIGDALDAAFSDMPRQDRDLERLPPKLRHLAIYINLGLSIVRGLLESDVFYRGFDCIDNEEWSDWMYRHGALRASLTSGLVGGFYDYIFGRPDKPNVGAGTATRALLRLLFCHDGYIFYTMNATMGDFLFAPLYEVLHARGVVFKFFHRIDKLRLSADKTTIEGVEIGVQMEPIDASGYDPLIEAGGCRSWPAAPVYDRLKKGAKLKRSRKDLESAWCDWPDVGQCRLRRGKEFDAVVLGIGLGALETICDELIIGVPGWKGMIENVKTCPTLASQLWLAKDSADYGWPYPRTIVTAFARPLHTYADNSQLLASEPNADHEGRASLAYFVGNWSDRLEMPPRPGDSFPDDELARAEASVGDWMRDELPQLWPSYTADDIRIGPYVRVNINPSDRYVLSVTGSVGSRLRPDGSGVDNLYLAGDWTRIGLNAGCVEQAVMSGRAAAEAITGVEIMIYNRDDGLDNRPASPGSVLLPFFSLLPRAVRVAYAGSGTVDACCAVGLWDRKIVERFLPSGLELDVQPPFAAATAKQKWPVAMMFAQHTHVRPGFALPGTGFGYNEFLVLIPSVLHPSSKTYNGPFCYMPFMLLDALLPVVVGVGAYGFKKQLARIRVKADSFDIRGEFGRVSAGFENRSLPGTIDDFAGLSTYRKVFEQPVISETSTGHWIYSSLDHHFDTAQFQAIEGDVFLKKIDHTFHFVGIPTGRTIAPMDVAFRLRTNWDLTFPIVDAADDTVARSAANRAFVNAVAAKLFGRFDRR